MKSITATLPATGSRIADFVGLTKPRLNALAVASVGVGYWLGATSGINPILLLNTVLGSALVAGGAAALNQVAEQDLDETMNRTRGRPLPTGRIKASEARVFGISLAAIGTVELALGASVLTAIVAITTLVSYLSIYTPLKRRTPWSTLVGAVPGALPPVIGWAAATGTLGVEALSLFGILFLWQLPHFHALAWMYRDDFRRGGLPLLAVLDPEGLKNARIAALFTALLIPVSLVPSLVGLTGSFYVSTALSLGVAFLILAWRLTRVPSTTRARTLFLGSLIYLPLLWSALIIDVAF